MSENNDQPSSKKGTLTGLAKRLSRLSPEKRRVALEVTASLASVSLRVSRDFVEAVPKASKVFTENDLREWGETGRKLAMANADIGADFFRAGAANFKLLLPEARTYVFQVAKKQLILSTSVALETFEKVPLIAKQVNDEELLKEILKLAVLIAGRSAKHSGEFLNATPYVAEALETFGESKDEVAKAALKLGTTFAGRTGGMTADLWKTLPEDLKGLSAASAIKLLDKANEYLDLGGSVTLHFLASAGATLRQMPTMFEEWCGVLNTLAPHGNSVLIGFLRSTPKFIEQMLLVLRPEDAKLGSKRVLVNVQKIANIDAESALAAFKSAPVALRSATLEQFDEWVDEGLMSDQDASKARRSFFALETRESNAKLKQTRLGLDLESVMGILRIYIEGLTGREVVIEPLTTMPEGSRIGDGKTIRLPALIAEFENEEKDFRLYKVLAAHGAGQIEFGTFVQDTISLKAAYESLSSLYDATAEDTDSFSLAGYLEDIQTAKRALTDEEVRAEIAKRRRDLPKNSDHKAVLKVFPDPSLAKKIFGTMENARIDKALRLNYRGLRKDLDLMRDMLGERRPFIFDVPYHQVPFELLFQITMCGGASDDARQFYGQIVSEIETIIEHTFEDKETTVADSLMATSRVYTLFQNLTPEESDSSEASEADNKTEFEYEGETQGETVAEEQKKKEARRKQVQDIKDLFSAWNQLDEDDQDQPITGSEMWAQSDIPEIPLEAGDEAFAYDEWDRELNDYRVGWSRVIEKKVKKSDRTFVEITRSRYRGVISSIKHQFQLMKPENLTKIHREIDGEDYDLNALIEYYVDKKADGRPSDRIYTKRLRRQRDVAVSILLDQSSSTARTITKNPLQPYTYPGRRIIEIEKEGLVLMSEALEAVGDLYAINGFTSEGRRNVKFYVIKDFNEKYSEEIEGRIGGITFQNNTRLGAAIRHAAAKLLRQESRTKLLIILTDGRPYDHDYGDARYAREDVREALTESKMSGIIPFCITIDRESEAELRDLYGDVGYTIIDDVLSLPERIPNIYRRLTT